jgi:hypothetical protein
MAVINYITGGFSKEVFSVMWKIGFSRVGLPNSQTTVAGKSKQPPLGV